MDQLTAWILLTHDIWPSQVSLIDDIQSLRPIVGHLSRCMMINPRDVDVAPGMRWVSMGADKSRP